MKHSGPELFVGITSWNSSLFLHHCVKAVLNTTQNITTRVVVLDNNSQDGSPDIARQMGVEVLVSSCNQPAALNRLFDASRSRFTLLMHSDVILLSARWYPICTAQLKGNVALVSPEDIGCGPYSRPFGIGKPESSFMLFDTAKARKIRTLYCSLHSGFPWPRRRLDFFGPHVTHRLPQHLHSQGYAWKPMNVLISPDSAKPIYTPPFVPTVWSEELAHLRYGLGNFYSLDCEITHYHNWYDRAAKEVAPDSTETTGRDGSGFPSAYIHSYTANFLADYTKGQLLLPSPEPSARAPRAL